mmetsp:Transcript_100750/g.282359  ORF Transcript_100750/g.282359 Transcript_100750/m.282359 type:complete len:105 (-) Transcript_100750:210-524(-)
MTWITCRPFPLASTGIGEWITILDVINYSGVCMAPILLMCVLSTPLEVLQSPIQLTWVVGIILSLFAIKVFLSVALHERPIAIVDAIDQNHDFQDAYGVMRNRD